MKTLGIDLGTTKVAVVIVENRHLLAAESAPHHAAVSLSDPDAAEQDVNKIFRCVKQLIARFPDDLCHEIQAVGITGQMHSIMFTGKNGEFSHLTTWQDHRCKEHMLSAFKERSALQLREGFGGTTLARLALEGNLSQYTAAAAIGDMLGAYLCGNDRICTDPTHAASWGIWDPESKNWNFHALEALNINPDILPEILPSGAVIGKISAERSEEFGIPAGIPVINAIGDNQASILGTGQNYDQEIYLTLGTGAQLSVVVPEDYAIQSEILEARPFPNHKALLVAAPLCGGSAFAVLADTVNEFRKELGEAPLSRGELLDKLDTAALTYLTGNGKPEIHIQPHFCGERYNPELRGTIEGLTLNNITPGKLAAALAVGIIQNLKKDFPEEILLHKKMVIGSGNAVRLLKSIQFVIQQEFALPLQLSNGVEEAAAGAAIFAGDNAKA